MHFSHPFHIKQKTIPHTGNVMNPSKTKNFKNIGMTSLGEINGQLHSKTIIVCQ